MRDLTEKKQWVGQVDVCNELEAKKMEKGGKMVKQNNHEMEQNGAQRNLVKKRIHWFSFRAAMSNRIFPFATLLSALQFSLFYNNKTDLVHEI